MWRLGWKEILLGSFVRSLSAVGSRLSFLLSGVRILLRVVSG